MKRSLASLSRLCTLLALVLCLAAPWRPALAEEPATSANTPATSADKAALRWRFQAGDEFGYTMSQNMTIGVLAMNQNVKNTIDQEMHLTWRIKSVDDKGNAKVEQSLERIVVKIDGPLGTSRYDSKEATKLTGVMAMLNTIYDALAGSEFKFTMSPRGEVTNFKVPQKLKKALSSLPGGQAGMLSEESLKEMVTQAGAAFPEQPLAKGDTWEQTNETKVPMLGTLKAKLTYTYQGRVDRGGQPLDQIDVAAQLELEPDAGAGGKLKSQESSGTVLFDNETGRLRESEIKQTMVMELNILNQKLEQSVEQTTSVKQTEPAAEGNSANSPAPSSKQDEKP